MPASIGPLMGAVGPFLRQQAFVVRELQAAKEAMGVAFGCHRWFEFESTVPWNVRGEDVRCDMNVAFSRVGDLQIELIEPTAGSGLFHEQLDRSGPGAHHLGFLVDDFDGLRELAIAEGFPPIMSGTMGESRYCFLDTWDTIGIYLELVHDPGDLMRMMMPWWDDPMETE